MLVIELRDSFVRARSDLGRLRTTFVFAGRIPLFSSHPAGTVLVGAEVVWHGNLCLRFAIFRIAFSAVLQPIIGCDKSPGNG